MRGGEPICCAAHGQQQEASGSVPGSAPNAAPAADALQPTLRCGFRAQLRRGVGQPQTRSLR
jgi:hypothetical protein